MTDMHFTLYRSDLLAARRHAADSGQSVKLAGGGRYGDPENQVSMQAADAMWGVHVATLDPDGKLTVRRPVRLIEDTILEPGDHAV
jgi:hypothetical protein